MLLLSHSMSEWRACLTLAGVLYVSGGALAADAYVIPELALTGEHHANIDLNPGANSGGTKQDVSGYSALASAVLGWRTPRSVTELRPRVQFYDYPERDELRRTNQSLDLSSKYGSLRSEWELVGHYSKQTTYEAQRADAQYDEFDPDDPIVNTARRDSLIAETRTRVQVRPNYTFRFSQRIGAEIDLLYQNERFGGSSASSNVDYSYMLATGSLLWALGPSTQLGTGVYGSKYDGDDADETTAKGVTFGVQHNWSQTLTGTATVNYEQADAKNEVLSRQDSSNNWEFELGLVKRGQVSSVRFNGGRTLNPSGIGSRTVVDQARFQYLRSLSQRWAFTGALRGYRSRAQGTQIGIDENRDQISVYTQLGWNVTRTWVVTGGYSYYWQKYQTDTRNADDHVVAVGVSYKGLRPQ